MTRSGKWQCKKKPKKRGPKSFRELAKLPARSGLRRRNQYRKNAKKSKASMKTYRTHYRLMWDNPWSGKYCRSLIKKGFKPPGSYSKTNQHGGVMPALPGEFKLTGFQAAQILEKVATSGTKLGLVSYSQVRGVSKCLSYLHTLKTGISGKNWSRVEETLGGFKPTDFEVKRTMVPTKIPSVANLKRAFTTEYNDECGMKFAKWVTGLLSTWCWCVFGCRTQCDIKSLKDSTVHVINHKDRWASTAYKGGRNKLPDKKSGTRPWNCFFVCMCKEGDHRPPPLGWEWTIRPDGSVTQQPPFCTVCPLNLLELKRRMAHRSSKNFKLFSKWSKTPQCWASNRGSCEACDGVVGCSESFDARRL